MNIDISINVAMKKIKFKMKTINLKKNDYDDRPDQT
jgi:hypothetical protein